MTLQVRVAYQVPLAVCLNGHAVPIGEVEKTTEILHDRCGLWTWQDGKFCVNCGGKLEQPEREANSHDG